MLPLSFDRTLHALQHPSPLTVYDTHGEYIHGSWQESAMTKRETPLRAIVLAMKTADLQFFKESYSTDSGISLHCKATLYWVDVRGVSGGECATAGALPAQEHRQSYVEYQGYMFRVVGTGFMMGNTTFNLYHCVRYMP